MIQIVAYRDSHFEGVDQLWRTVFPGEPPRNHAQNAVPLKMALSDNMFWVAEEEDGSVVGTIIAGWDGHRGWLYTVAVDPEFQRAGVGRQMVDHALAELRERGCTKVNLQIRAGNEPVAAFYRDLGFAIEDRISMGREL